METSTLVELSYIHESDYMTKNSFYDSNPDLEPLAEDEDSEFLIILSIVILSLIGNIVVVVISVFCARLRSLTSIFILNLALSDLLFTAVLAFRIWGLARGEVACKAVHFIFAAGYYSSIAFHVLMSAQRYMAVVQPQSGWKKRCYFTCVLVCAWVMSFLAALPVMAYISTFTYPRVCTYIDNTARIAIMYEHSIVFVCAFLAIAICYIRILQTTLKSPPNQRRRTTWLAFFLVATFFISWAPYTILNFHYAMTYQQIKPQTVGHFVHASYICSLLAFTRCCLNPVIYGLFGIKFHKDLKEVFQRRETPNSEQMGIEECHSNRSVSV